MQLRAERVLDQSEIHGAEAVADMTITASSKAFQILMSGIYSNKIGAVVREISTNAWDAHADAGNLDKPFQIHVPSTFDPRFYVRDYGVSMDQQTVMELYSSLFASSKTNSNNVAGAFGIGSKAPFAYVDGFQVTTWLDGVKSVYQCQMQTGGIPMVAKIGSVESDEPRGVMVELPVRSEDVKAFRTEIRRMLLGFDTMPELLNVDLTQDDFFGKAAMIKANRTGTDWRLFGEDFHNALSMSGLIARQGCVIYPIDMAQINDAARTAGKADVLALFKPDYRSVSDTTAVLDFDIGRLSVAASREALQYDEETIDAIVGRLETLANEMIGDATALIQGEATALRAAKAYSKLALGNTLKTMIGKRVTYPFPTVDKATGNVEVVDTPIEDIRGKYGYGVRINADKLQREHGLIVSPIRQSSKSRPSFRPAYQLVIDVWNGAQFVIDDGQLDRATNRVAAYIEDFDGSAETQLWWVRPADKSSLSDFRQRVKAWIDGMNADLSYEELSDYDAKNFTTGDRSGVDKRDYNAFRSVNRNGTLTEIQHDPKAGGVYVLLKKGRVLWTDPKGEELSIDPDSLHRMLDTLVQAADRIGVPIPPITIIGIIGNSHTLVEKYPGWISLQGMLTKWVTDNITESLIADSARRWSVCNEVENKYTDLGRATDNLITASISLISLLPAGHAIAQIATQRTEDRKSPQLDRYALQHLARFFNVKTPTLPATKAKHILLASRAMKVYPLLQHMDATSVNKDALVQYINLVDAA